MLKCLLNSIFLLTAFASAAQNQTAEGEVEGLKELAMRGDDSVGSLFPNKTTIGENELSQLERSLDEIDGDKTKQKREAQTNWVYMDDELGEANNEQQSPDVKANYDIKTSVTDIEVPTKSGSPAFSIHASKVYILYPSLFQDPNIFGRFSIPQNINLDPLPDKQVAKSSETVPKVDPPVVMKPNMPNYNRLANNGNSSPYNPYQSNKGRRLMRRQVENPPPAVPQQNDEENKKRNVETHLTGTIVVLNQDVNESNRKDAY